MGDDNTKYFFAKSKQKKMATYIYALENDTEQMEEGFEKVDNIMFHYYQSILGSDTGGRLPIVPEVTHQGNTLTQAQQLLLTLDFSEKEIKDAMSSIHKLKSPGPDGFNSGFFHSTWSTTGSLICAAIKDFFKTGQAPRRLFETKLILLPKTLHPTKAGDF